MAHRIIYATIRIDLADDKVDEITDEQVEDFVQKCLYDFPSTKDMEVFDTTWEETRY